MNWKHLLWIIPTCIIIGFLINYTLQIGLSMLGWELANKMGQEYTTLTAFTDAQEKCLYTTRATDYESCYWEAKAQQDEAKQLAEILGEIK